MILGCFRPDGADAGEPGFAEALRLAAEDRELGEWLARERARDAAFAAALGRVEIPAGLRDEILAGFAVERGDLPQAEDRADATFIGALATVRPPEGLRERILAAMQEQAASRREGRGRRSARPGRWFWRCGVPLAAAAAVVLALSLWSYDDRLPVAAVEAGVRKVFDDPAFRLDLTNADHQALFKHLKALSLPCPCPRTLPPGLAEVDGVGCRLLEIDGHRGSLVCFDEREAGVVHLVVFFRDEIEGELPDVGHPAIEQHGEWAVASWGNDEAAFMLLGVTRVERLAALF